MKILFPIISALFIFGCASYKDHNNKASSNSGFYVYSNSSSANNNVSSTYPKMRVATTPSIKFGASHGSYYKSIDMSKPVYVRGYFRKNGSYVRPHTRSYRRR